MPTSRVHGMFGDLRRAALLAGDSGMTDGQLLGEFIARRDEAAFARLVGRHGPMVFGVCRRLLGHRQDAEDAFQATFIVLARKAGSVRPREQVGNWLYGVAYRTALNARRLAARRHARERQVTDMPHPAVEPEAPWHELRPVLDEELNRLPTKYRLPIVLCDLEGRTRKEVARQLELPEGTLSNRLAAGRGLLAARLSRRGLTLSAAGLATALAEASAAAGVPAGLAAITVRTALGMAIEGAATVGVSANVAALAKGVMHNMFLTKLKMATAALLLVGLLGAGFGGQLVNDHAQGQEPQREAPAAQPKAAAAQKLDDPKAKQAGRETRIVERGSIQPAVFTDLVCALPSATIQWVMDDGARVKKGDQLVTLSDPALRERIREQDVALEQARTGKAAAEAKLKRIAKENELNVSAAEIDVMLAKAHLRQSANKDAVEREIMELKVRQAQIELERVRLRGEAKGARALANVAAKTKALEHETFRKREVEILSGASVLHAPHDGIAVHYVSEARGAGPGAVVAAGEPVRRGQKLIRVLGEDRLLMLIHVPEAQIPKVRPGQPASIRVDAFPNQILDGKVKKVSTVASPVYWLNRNVKVYPVEVELTDPLRGLKPGMTGEVGIELERRGK